LRKSEYTDARSIHAQILQNPRQDPIRRAFALVNIAEIDVLIGATEDMIQQNLNEATTIFSTMKYSYGVTCCETILADVKLRQGDTQSAITLFRQCLKSTWGRDIEVVSHIVERLADRTHWQALQCTFTWPVLLLGHAQQSKQKLAVYKAFLFIGEIFIAEGDDDTAKSLFTLAQEGFFYMDVHRSRARCLLRLGDLADKKGNSSEALELWKAARPLFERASQVKDIVQIDARLAEREYDQKVLVHLATMPETIVTESSGEVDPAGIRKRMDAGQKSPEGVMVSAM
jgi:predicted negative regulator of RcsB-dependent stress response